MVNTKYLLFIVFLVLIACTGHGNFGCGTGSKEGYDTILVDEYDSLAIEKEIKKYGKSDAHEDDFEYSEEKMKETEMKLNFDACYSRNPELRESLRAKGFGFW